MVRKEEAMKRLLFVLLLTGCSADFTVDGDINIDELPEGTDVITTGDSLRATGWDESGGEENYKLIENYVKSGPSGTYTTITTIKDINARWEVGEYYPVAFYGDSTTDGATTSDHETSFSDGAISNFKTRIEVNTSPNSYSRKLESYLLDVNSNSSVKIYNAGFDSMSLKNDFGNKMFHRVFFGYEGGLNNVDYSDVKAIFFAWGTSDSINQGEPEIIRESYEWKMELLIIECFERGIQPFIVNPVLNFQRVGGDGNGRNNNESITIIESINQKLAVKYNLEVLSLREPLESYSVSAENEKDFTEVLARDGVHPNDKGHRQIASWLASKFNPIIKTIKGEYQFTAGNPHVITTPEKQGVKIWRDVNSDYLVTETSKYYRFDSVESEELLYSIFIFNESEMGLTYDMISFANDQRGLDRTASVKVFNYTDESRIRTHLTSGDMGVKNIGYGSPFTSGSHQYIATLNPGLNKIEVVAPVDNLYSRQNLGFLRVGSANKRTAYSGIIKTSGTESITWSSDRFEQSEYHLTELHQTSELSFVINSLNNANIYWNGNRAFRDFDSYNVLKFEEGNIKLFRGDSTNFTGGETVETLLAEGSVTLPSGEKRYFIRTSLNYINATDLSVYYLDGDKFVELAFFANVAHQLYSGGYGLGVRKMDGTPVALTDAQAIRQ
jgi:hypothetical protein